MSEASRIRREEEARDAIKADYHDEHTITPENVEYRTWTKDTVHNFDIRFTETQVLMLKNAIEVYQSEYDYPGSPRGDNYWKQMKILLEYLDRILRVRYSTLT